MPVTHMRIDNRLIHGQVVVSWIRAEQSDLLMVANDGIARDDFQRSILLAVAPPSIREIVLAIDDALAYIASQEHARERVFLLVKTPADALRLVRGGLAIQTVNVGNMAFVVGAKRVSNTVFVTPADVVDFTALHDAGITLTCRMMPTERANDFMKMLDGAHLLARTG
jgi:mannose/fructose/N-acetylgalactosamine-specific phosphotransferase system component IIB